MIFNYLKFLSENEIINSTLILIGIILFILNNCYAQQNKITNNYGKENNLLRMDNLEQSLQKRIEVERQNPFIIREFETQLNGKWIGNAVSYGCYREGQAPNIKGPTESEILEDLKIITEHWNLIRVYGSDTDSERILEVIRKYKLPVKVMLGIWLEDERENTDKKAQNIQQVLTCIRLCNKYDEIISAVNVGNETQVFWSAHRMNIEDLIYYIRVIRKYTNKPVTTADDYNFWNKTESKLVEAEVDFIVVHIYPLWNGKELDESIDWMNNIFFNQIKSFHTEKAIILGEIGWATNYDSTKIGDGQQGSLIKGEVSLNAQEKFLIKLSEWINKNRVTTFLFEAFDEPWKGGGLLSDPNEIEKHWGVFYKDRTPKQSFINYLKKINKINNSINNN